MSAYSDILDACSVSFALIVPPNEFDRVLAEHPPSSDGYPQPDVIEVLSRSKFTFINAFGVPATGAPDVDYIRDIFNRWLITTSRYAAGIHQALAVAASGTMAHSTASMAGIDGTFHDWDWEFTYFRTRDDEPRFLITGRNVTRRVSLVRSRTAYENQLELMLAEREESVAEAKHSLDAEARLVLSLVGLRNDAAAEHMRAVADIADELAERLKVDPRKRSEIRAAALIHNVGLLGVPSDLLSKHGALSEIEESVMREHVRTGADLLTKAGFDETIVSAVLQHHERWDGSGYPNGLAGLAIGLDARILAVADAIAELRRRVEGKSLSPKTIASRLEKEAGSGYDPDIVAAARDMILSSQKR